MKASLRIALSGAVAVSLLVACGSDGAPTGAEDQRATPPPVVTSETPEETGAPAPVTETEDPSCESSSREKYQKRPLITVTAPCTGGSVSSPVTVEGEANVFEATVSLRLLDETGAEIASGFTTAECGTGCWGDFEGSLDFEVFREQSGTLEVFESSAEDGSDIHKVSIPITLLP